MWVYVASGAMWGGIIAGWLIPVIRKRITCEIYEACGLGSLFTLVILGHGKVGTQLNIPALQIIGLVILVTDSFLVVSAFAALKRKGKPETGWESTTVMISSNIFRVVRHPLYLGTAVVATGLSLLFQSILTTITAIVTIFCCWMASRKEDAFNIEKFGDSYREYMENVPMWNAFKGLRNRGL